MVTDRENERANGRSSPQTARQLVSDLCQPLTAASNYVGTAQDIVRAGDAGLFGAAIDLLEKAGHQILAAGKIASRLHDCLDCDRPESDDSDA